MISLVAAVAANGVIGAHNDLPWRIPEDWIYFKKLTTGKTILMGRKTFESLGKPLPQRKHLVITRQKEYSVPEEVDVYASVDDALKAHPKEDVYIIGGGEIFKETIGIADTLYITHIEKAYEGDTYFPAIDPHVWKEVSRDPRDGFAFVKYTKK